MSHGNKKFGTTVNCMDGRAVEATINCMKGTDHLDFVDTITEPGMDGLLHKMTPEQRAWLKWKLEISIVNHGSRVVSFVGHDDCAGNPVQPEEHKEHIRKGVEVVKTLVGEINSSLPVAVFGLWAHAGGEDEAWIVEKV